MAGSYSHCVADDGQLLRNEDCVQMIENLGDAYEAIEEMYELIWILANGERSVVATARAAYGDGLRISPGINGTLYD